MDHPGPDFSFSIIHAKAYTQSIMYSGLAAMIQEGYILGARSAMSVKELWLADIVLHELLHALIDSLQLKVV